MKNSSNFHSSQSHHSSSYFSLFARYINNVTLRVDQCTSIIILVTKLKSIFLKENFPHTLANEKWVLQQHKLHYAGEREEMQFFYLDKKSFANWKFLSSYGLTRKYLHSPKKSSRLKLTKSWTERWREFHKSFILLSRI